MSFIEKLCDSVYDAPLLGMHKDVVRGAVEDVVRRVNPALEYLGASDPWGFGLTLDFAYHEDGRTAIVAIPFTRRVTRASLMHDLHPDNLEYPTEWQYHDYKWDPIRRVREKK